MSGALPSLVPCMPVSGPCLDVTANLVRGQIGSSYIPQSRANENI